MFRKVLASFRQPTRFNRKLAARILNLTAAPMAAFDDDLTTKMLESIGIICKTISANPASIAAGAEGTIDVDVDGVLPAHKLFVTLAADVTVGLYLRSAVCSTPGTVTLTFANHSAGAIDEAAHNVNLLAIPGELN